MTAVPNTGGSSTTSRVPLGTEDGELSSVPSYRESLADLSVSTVNRTSKKEAVLSAVESRRLEEYLPGPQRMKITKVGVGQMKDFG